MIWTKERMKTAAKNERLGAYIQIDGDEEDLLLIDEVIFKSRPDLILRLSTYDSKTGKHKKFAQEYLDALIKMTHVKNIAITSSNQQDYSFLSDIYNLQYLELDTKNDTDISFLATLKHLNYLYLSGRFNTFDSIGLCKSLKTLLMAGLRIDDFSFLNKSSVDYLLLDSCRVEQWSSFSKNESIKFFQLSSNHLVDDLDFISLMTSLECLSISQNKIVQLINFEHLKKLKELHLCSVKSLVDISFLKTAASLETLYINEISAKVKIDDFKVLLDMPSLKNLYIDFLDYTKRTEKVKNMIVDHGKGEILKTGLCVMKPSNMPSVLAACAPL